MNETRWNPAQRGLLVFGLLGLLVGGIMALTGKSNGDAAAAQDVLTNAVFKDGGLGSAANWDTAGGAYGVMWAGVVIVAIGLVLLIVLVAVKAQTPPHPPA